MNNKPFIYESLYIDWDPKIYGWGVFTKEEIPEYTVIETCAVVLYPSDILKIAAWNAANDKHTFSSLGLTLYSLRWDEEFSGIPLGFGGMYNHSDKNNCQFISNKEEGLLHIVTLRVIQPGEQMLVSYGEDWFQDKPFPKIDL